MPEPNRHTNRLRAAFIFGLILLMASGAVVVALYGLQEPTQDGKTISYWISQLGEPEPASGNAHVALNKLGAQKTMRYLALALGQKETGWRKYYRAHYPQLPGFVRRFLQPPKQPITDYGRSRIAYYLSAHANESTSAAKATAPMLASLLSDSDASVRFSAGLALSGFGTNAAPAVPVIGRLLQAEPQKVHDVMLMVLEQCGTSAKMTIPVLQECLGSSNAHLRISCARTLWLLDKSQAELVRLAAKGALATADAGVRIEAASLLWRMDKDPKEVVFTLATLLSDTEKAYDYRTIKLLGQIGPPAREAMPALQAWLTNQRAQAAFISNSAVEALQKIGGAP